MASFQHYFTINNARVSKVCHKVHQRDFNLNKGREINRVEEHFLQELQIHHLLLLLHSALIILLLPFTKFESTYPSNFFLYLQLHNVPIKTRTHHHYNLKQKLSHQRAPNKSSGLLQIYSWKLITAAQVGCGLRKYPDLSTISFSRLLSFLSPISIAPAVYARI